MPHIPRTLAPSGLTNSDGVPRAPLRTTAEKPPVPYMGSGDGEANPADRKQERKKLLGRISMEDWDVDPLKVYQYMTGKELAVDEHSRLVS